MTTYELKPGKRLTNNDYYHESMISIYKITIDIIQVPKA